MIKIIKKNNRGPAQYRRHQSSGAGFVILFAVTLSAILLSIALGVSSIALKEIKFGTSAKDTDEAFFAADSGIECAVFNDKSTGNSFTSFGSGDIQCLGNTIRLAGSYPVWSFILSGLGSQAQGCAQVTVDKSKALVVVVSKGYNNGGDIPEFCTQGLNSIERQIELKY
jgi:hypothetical protein